MSITATRRTSADADTARERRPDSRLRAIRLVAAACLMIGLATMFGGCISAASAPDPAAATDPQRDTAFRLAAIRALPRDRAFELFELVTVSRHPLAVRSAAVDRMLDADADRFWSLAAARSAQVDDWPMIRLLCDRASQRQEQAALPWLVRSWSAVSTTVDDADRPERQAIKVIAADPPTDTLHGMVFSPSPDDELATRVAAWTVLCRLGPMHDALSTIATGTSDPPTTKDDPLLDALGRCYRQLQTYPVDREDLARLFTLTWQMPEPLWQACSRWSDRHPSPERSPMQLRHLPAVARLQADRIDWTKTQWLGQITQRLHDARHVSRGEDAGERIVTARPERLADHADQLTAADLLVLNAMLDALDDDALAAELFRQADADRLDTSSELGGVLTWDAGDRPVARAFAPLIRRHDQVYYAPSACVRAMHTGLAHYHFHAQDHDNAAWAGPGKGERPRLRRAYARELRRVDVH